MKFLITGGTGFIGTALCRYLTDEMHSKQHQVTVLSRQPERVPELCGPEVRAVSAFQQLNPSEVFDVVINLAGEPIADRPWTTKRRQVLRDSRLGVSRQLLAWLETATHKPKVMISGSAIGFYGDQGDHLLDEQCDAVNDFSHQLCRDWEAVALSAADLGIRVCVVRIGLVIGPEGGFLDRMMPVFKLGLGGPLGNGQQWMSWVHREDLIAIIDFLANHQVLNGVFNAVSPNPVTNSDFSKALAAHLRRPCWLPVPAYALKLGMGEMSSLLLGSQRVVPFRIQQAGFNFKYETLGQALASL